MKKLAERLKFVLYKLDISQTEAAKRCGLSQQSINYIVRNNLSESKLSNRLASGLNVNPEWLIYGTGNFRNPEIFRIPIIDNYFTLGLHNRGKELNEDIKYILTTRYLGKKPFAIKVEKNKIAICCSTDYEINPLYFTEYLSITEDAIKLVKVINHNDMKNLYIICEWRIYNVNI